MKAFAFTSDRLSYDLLARGLQGHGFSNIELCEPNVESVKALPQTDSDYLIILDLDAPDASKLALDLPSGIALVTCGSHDSWRKHSGSILEHFLMKPLDRDAIMRVVKTALLGNVSMQPRPTKERKRSPEEFAEDWRRVLNMAVERRSELRRLLTASAEQLRSILATQAVMGENGPQVPPEAFPLQSVLIVEEDESLARVMSRYLARRCVMEADIATSGKDAWQKISSRTYDAIILQWEVTSPGGLALYNRLRTLEPTKFVPVVVTSSQLRLQDFRLFDEDFAVCLLSRPAQEMELAESLAEVVSAAQLGKERLEELIVLACEAVESDYMSVATAQMQGQELDTVVLGSLKVAGDRFLQEERYEAAERAFAAAWHLGDRRLSLLTGYAKACYLLGRQDEARNLLTTADALAPGSVERLCLLGEIDLWQRKPQEARERFLEVLAIDKGVRKARAGVEVARAMESDGEIGETSAAVTHFASYLNLIGINLSRGGKIDQATSYYKSAMTFVRGRQDLAKLWFNLGICNLRGQRHADAEKSFQMAHEISAGQLVKAAKYIANAKRAEKGESSGEDEMLFEKI